MKANRLRRFVGTTPVLVWGGVLGWVMEGVAGLVLGQVPYSRLLLVLVVTMALAVLVLP
jgi:hypothetical protein